MCCDHYEIFVNASSTKRLVIQLLQVFIKKNTLGVRMTASEDGRPLNYFCRPAMFHIILSRVLHVPIHCISNCTFFGTFLGFFFHECACWLLGRKLTNLRGLRGSGTKDQCLSKMPFVVCNSFVGFTIQTLTKITTR